MEPSRFSTSRSVRLPVQQGEQGIFAEVVKSSEFTWELSNSGNSEATFPTRSRNIELLHAAFTTFSHFCPWIVSENSHASDRSCGSSRSAPLNFRNSELFFARIGSGVTKTYVPPAIKKVEYYSLHRVKPDGRCMFRALVQGMATNKGMSLTGDEETAEADELRLAVADALCNSEKRRTVYEEALIAVTVEESLKRYCGRIKRADFWGGESELLVLSRMCSQPIIVYIPESLAKREGARWGTGYVPIAEYGSEFARGSKAQKSRRPVRLLYNGVNHYDLLL